MERPSKLERMEQMTAFYRKNEKILDTLELLDADENYATLRGVAENHTLFNKYLGLGKDKTIPRKPENDMKKFGNVKDALDYAANGKVVVYFADINLYAVFAGNQDCKELRTMLSNIVQNAREARQKKREKEREAERELRGSSYDSDDSEDSKEEAKYDPTFNVKQIVLSDHKQRMVFVSSNGSLEMIREYVKTFFKSDITTVDSPEGVEITVLNRTFDNLNEIKDELDRLCSKIDEKHPAVLRGVRPLYRRTVHPYVYVDPLWDTADPAYEGDKIRDMLKSDWFEGYPGTVNIVNNYSCTGVSMDMRVMSEKTRKSSAVDHKNMLLAEAARKWIAANPPKPGELRGEYYERYKRAASGYISIKLFAGLMLSLGYCKLDGKERTWGLPQ